MTGDGNEWKWKAFVEIGNTIHKMRGHFRILHAKAALKFSDSLIESNYITNSKERYDLYETLLPKIVDYLDENTEVIQNSVEKYFFGLHCKNGLEEYLFDINFSPKKSGIQTGFTCDVSNGKESNRYYIKTHQYGPTDDNPKSMQPVDVKELFIYKLLQCIGIGPEVHFIISGQDSKRSAYIATKDCQLTLLSELTKESANMKALVQLDLISHILCLQDCATNPSNCGQVDGQPMIVDFRIDSQPGGYVKLDIVDRLLEGIGAFDYRGLMTQTFSVLKEEKLCILKESLQAWNLRENMDGTKLEMDSLLKKMADKINVQDDLQRYVEDVKETINLLFKV